MTRCTWSWIFLQQYVITFCETITKCAYVQLRVATECYFTSAFLVWHMTRCTILPNNLWRLHFFHTLLATIITYRFCLLVRIRSEKCHWKLYSCFHAFALCYIYTGMVTGMLQCFKNARSYYFGSWIMGNLPSYCMYQEYFLIRRWSLQWKGSCHLEHSCGLMAELSAIFGQSFAGNMIHNVYGKGR
jgi:hypothetical protein